MPITQSAAKRMRQSRRRRLVNIAVRSTIQTSSAKLDAVIATRDRTKAEAAYWVYCSVVDKALKKGVITPHTAARKKSRAWARVVKGCAATGA